MSGMQKQGMGSTHPTLANHFNPKLSNLTQSKLDKYWVILLSPMNSPNENEDEDDVFIKLREEDVKIAQELENVHEDEKIVQILQKRVDLYRKYYTRERDPIVMEIMITQEEIIKLQMGLVNERHRLQTDIAKLTTRIDDLEGRLTK